MNLGNLEFAQYDSNRSLPKPNMYPLRSLFRILKTVALGKMKERSLINNAACSSGWALHVALIG